MKRFNWVGVGAGRMTLSQNIMGKKTFPFLKESGCDYVVTLISAHEGGERVGEMVKGIGLRWHWLPLRNGKTPTGEAKTMLIEAFPILSQELDRGASMLIHCAAGIHRTGMVAYTLLRWRGYNGAQSLDLIGQMRLFTREGVGQKRIEWGNGVIEETRHV
ncbi:MAG: tyrosine-protein phosphatase [Chloroflexi bacterium]|nr:tyrosine-protein phosphatase [Chloroflexota bacterium]